MQKVANSLVKLFNEPQSVDGPIAPKPGPMFPMDDADIASEEIISCPLIETTNEHKTNINI